jgi:hypothetical protein
MNDARKSDSSVVPRKSPNNAGRPDQEAAEGRGLTKGNSPQQPAFRTLCRVDAPNALERVRQAARRDRKMRFTALLHHVYDYKWNARSSPRVTSQADALMNEIDEILFPEYLANIQLEIKNDLDARANDFSSRDDSSI